MTDKVNYFERWLGINHVSPNHYELLSVDPGTFTPDELRAAAQRALERLKQTNEPGPVERRKQIAQQIKTALVVLSNPDLRKQYDATLTFDEIAEESATTASARFSAGDAPAIPIQIRAPRRRSQASGRWIWIAIIAIFVIGPSIPIGIIVLSTNPADSGRQAKSSNNGDEKLDRPVEVPPTPVAAANDINTEASSDDVSPLSTPQDMGAPNETEVVAGEEKLPGDDADIDDTVAADTRSAPHAAYDTRFRIDLCRARLSALDMAGAQRAVDVLEDADLGGPDSDYRRLLSDWKALALDVDMFWQEVEHHAGQLRAAREFTLFEDTASVVGVEPNHLLFRWRGNTLIARWDRLPPSLVLALLETVGIRDVPTWRKATAAWIIAQEDWTEIPSGEVQSWLEQCRADGLEVGHLLRLLEFFSRSESRDQEATAPDQPTFTELLIGVLQSPASGAPRGGRGEYEQLLEIARKSMSAEERTDSLIRAVRISIASARWERCQEAVTLLAIEHSLNVREVLLSCARLIAANDALDIRDAVGFVDELIELSGQGWYRRQTDEFTLPYLELAREVANRFQLRLQLNHLSLLF
ncbi:MAG TPA: hypothetical protein PKD54_03475 [Pirellulaceae bacterium]|nr:hypothetical protein [Pirellulaceae bacterium]